MEFMKKPKKTVKTSRMAATGQQQVEDEARKRRWGESRAAESANDDELSLSGHTSSTCK